MHWTVEFIAMLADLNNLFSHFDAKNIVSILNVKNGFTFLALSLAYFVEISFQREKVSTINLG